MDALKNFGHFALDVLVEVLVDAIHKKFHKIWPYDKETVIKMFSLSFVNLCYFDPDGFMLLLSAVVLLLIILHLLVTKYREKRENSDIQSLTQVQGEADQLLLEEQSDNENITGDEDGKSFEEEGGNQPGTEDSQEEALVIDVQEQKPKFIETVKKLIRDQLPLAFAHVILSFLVNFAFSRNAFQSIYAAVVLYIVGFMREKFKSTAVFVGVVYLLNLIYVCCSYYL